MDKLEKQRLRYESKFSKFKIPEELENERAKTKEKYNQVMEDTQDLVNYFEKFVQEKLHTRIINLEESSPKETDIEFNQRKITYEKMTSHGHVYHVFALRDGEFEQKMLYENENFHNIVIVDRNQEVISYENRGGRITYSVIDLNTGDVQEGGFKCFKDEVILSYGYPSKNPKDIRFLIWVNLLNNSEIYGMMDKNGDSEFAIGRTGPIVQTGKLKKFKIYPEKTVNEEAKSISYTTYTEDGSRIDKIETFMSDVYELNYDFEPENPSKRKGRVERYYPNGMLVYEGRFEGQALVEGRIENGGQVHRGTFQTIDGVLIFEGTMENLNGMTYRGKIINNKYEGEGEITTPDGSVFKGFFKEGKKVGKGKEVNLEGGFTFEGEFADDHANGHGTFDSEIIHYEGNYVNGRKEGKGVMRMKEDGSVYEGEFKEDKLEGEGSLTWVDGTYCKGIFKNGILIDGEFWRTFESLGLGDKKADDGSIYGMVYKGQFENGIFSGRGELTDPEGNRYVGEFREGAYNGEGWFYPKGMGENQGVLGKWENGSMVEIIEDKTGLQLKIMENDPNQTENIDKFSNNDFNELREAYYGENGMINDGDVNAMSFEIKPRGHYLASRSSLMPKLKFNRIRVSGFNYRFGRLNKQKCFRSALKMIRKGVFKF